VGGQPVRPGPAQLLPRLAGLAQYPQELADLLQDNRFPQAKRHIRRLYPDPISNSDEWGLLRSIDGRITGVYSRSDATPFKRSGFSAEWSGFEGLEHYSDWQFVAEQAFRKCRGVQTHAARETRHEAPGCAVPEPAAAAGHLAKAGAEDEMQGFIVDNTISHIGHDFYYYFADRLRATSRLDFNLVVRERPDARWGSLVTVEFEREVVYRRFLPPNTTDSKTRPSPPPTWSSSRSSSASCNACCRTPPTWRGTSYEPPHTPLHRRLPAGQRLCCQATELVYTPVNPAFGGNPLNGTWLLNNAQAQNDYDDPDLKDRTSPLPAPRPWSASATSWSRGCCRSCWTTSATATPAACPPMRSSSTSSTTPGPEHQGHRPRHRRNFDH
jgi:hypothetical protein